MSDHVAEFLSRCRAGICRTVVVLLLPAAALGLEPPERREGSEPADGGTSLDVDLDKLFVPMGQVRLKGVRVGGRLPRDASSDVFGGAATATTYQRRWNRGWLTWSASNLDHQPLYFDDVPLERYGQSVCPHLQPAISAARFFGTLPIMPYKIGLDRPMQCISTLGYYRPGSPTPCIHQSVPFSWDGATLEAVAWTGLVFALP